MGHGSWVMEDGASPEPEGTSPKSWGGAVSEDDAAKLMHSAAGVENHGQSEEEVRSSTLDKNIVLLTCMLC